MTIDSPEMVSMPLKVHKQRTQRTQTVTNTRAQSSVFVTQNLLPQPRTERPRQLPRELGQTDPPLAEAEIGQETDVGKIREVDREEKPVPLLRFEAAFAQAESATAPP